MIVDKVDRCDGISPTTISKLFVEEKNEEGVPFSFGVVVRFIYTCDVFWRQ